MKSFRLHPLVITSALSVLLIVYLYYTYNYQSQHYRQYSAADSSAALDPYPGSEFLGLTESTDHVISGVRRLYSFTADATPEAIGIWYVAYLKNNSWNLEIPAASSSDPNTIRQYTFRHPDNTILNLSLIPAEGITRIEVDIVPPGAYLDDKL